MITLDREKGFLYFFASLEELGQGKWREHARGSARAILKELGPEPSEVACVRLAESTLKANLCAFSEDAADWTSLMRSMMFDLPGWSGMFQVRNIFAAVLCVLLAMYFPHTGLLFSNTVLLQL